MADFSLTLNTSKMDGFLSRLEGKSPEILDLVLKRIGFEAQNRITARTPVGKTGRARAGWMGEFKRENPHRATFTISNNVPYVIFLEYGHSKQAPHGMVRITLHELSDFRTRGGKAFQSAILDAAHDAGAR